MKDFRRPSGQGAGRGGFDKREQGSESRSVRPPFGAVRSDRPGYGSHKGDHNSGERREVKHQAVCSDCGKTCEVPFRPNGSKPVYCKDCFGAKKGAPSHASVEKRDFPGHAHPAREERPAAPVRDSRIDELKSQMDAMQSKLDRILSALETAKAPAKAAPVSVKKEVKAVKKAVPAKKTVAKALPKKKKK